MLKLQSASSATRSDTWTGAVLPPPKAAKTPPATSSDFNTDCDQLYLPLMPYI